MCVVIDHGAVQASLEMDLGMMLGRILLLAAWICQFYVPTSNCIGISESF